VSAEASRIRVDALRNRNRILDVARALFAERGIDVPMAAIARRAGVGAATLYRRFPTKESLVTEVFADQFAVCVSLVDDALTDPDPWRGFCTVIRKVCDMQAVDRGFSAAFPEAERYHDRAMRSFAELTRRAKESGQLRPDFVPGDLVLLAMANSGITAEPAATLAASRRLVAYLLDAFRAQPNEPLPPPAPLNPRDVLG